ncbi:hypothetical protein HC251_07645 [Iamia sp. SCSIO 61187]|uniref:hypothetical protein n=1 Tax=Iamia sp. SCSIO 61187 TaxID=2722752 RepID=UPI001C634538|nr:hypothetical protein [Iamia sp. SCSIO 61187]QYG92326.1 hypothetical protein HC251_07645 [Iamia sp. SCSIO 61187]
MPRLPRRSPRRWPAVVVAALLVLGACSGDGDGEGSAGTDPADASGGDRVAVSAADLGPFTEVDPDDLAGPGTPLGAGLSVPEGAFLQGTTFPDLVGGGYRALLLVTGDTVAVFDALAGQASSLGMEGDAGCLGGLAEIGCEAELVDGSDGESLHLSAVRRVNPLIGVASGVGLLYRPPGSDDGGADPGGTPPTSPLPEVVLPDPVPAPPPEDVALAVRNLEGPARRLELGSSLVGLPGPCACAGGGWSMVVRLDGVERDVLHGYVRQLSDLGEAPDLEDRHRDDVTVLGVRVGEGAATAEIRATVPDDGQAYAIITVRPG